MVDVCAATCRVTHALHQGGNYKISDGGACLLADALKSSCGVTELGLVSDLLDALESHPCRNRMFVSAYHISGTEI